MFRFLIFDCFNTTKQADRWRGDYAFGRGIQPAKRGDLISLAWTLPSNAYLFDSILTFQLFIQRPFRFKIVKKPLTTRPHPQAEVGHKNTSQRNH